MFRRIVTTALLAGFIGGLGISAVQHFTTTPLILHAETYENPAENAATGDAHRHGALDRGLKIVAPALAHTHPGATEGEAEGWAPGDGLERTGFSLLANVLTGIGFALILTACFVLARRPVSGQEGVLWGIAGFGVISLAPALGLPPEVPGSMAAELTARQTWWFFCVAASAAGLWMMVFRKGAAWVVAGIALLALPHLVGAPQPERIGGSVPPELAGHFAAASLATAAIFWCMLGWLSGRFWQRFTDRV